MIKRKIKIKQERIWRIDVTEVEDMMNEGCFPELYNTIYYRLYDHNASKKYFGFAETTAHIKAIKIWSLDSDWESLITGQASPKQAVLGLILHHMTGSKDMINMLHKCNHTIFYHEIREQNMAWANMVSTRHSLLSNMRKGAVTHSTMDNNDRRQYTNLSVLFPKTPIYFLYKQYQGELPLLSLFGE